MVNVDLIVHVCKTIIPQSLFWFTALVGIKHYSISELTFSFLYSGLLVLCLVIKH